jgi:hypothetical protein
MRQNIDRVFLWLSRFLLIFSLGSDRWVAQPIPLNILPQIRSMGGLPQGMTAGILSFAADRGEGGGAQQTRRGSAEEELLLLGRRRSVPGCRRRAV